MDTLKQSILELITETSTNLPPDVRRAINDAKAKEDMGTRAALSLSTIAKISRWRKTTFPPFARILECRPLKSRPRSA